MINCTLFYDLIDVVKACANMSCNADCGTTTCFWQYFSNEFKAAVTWINYTVFDCSKGNGVDGLVRKKCSLDIECKLSASSYKEGSSRNLYSYRSCPSRIYCVVAQVSLGYSTIFYNFTVEKGTFIFV